MARFRIMTHLLLTVQMRHAVLPDRMDDFQPKVSQKPTQSQCTVSVGQSDQTKLVFVENDTFLTVTVFKK